MKKLISFYPDWVVIWWFHFVIVTAWEKGYKVFNRDTQQRKHKCSKWCRKKNTYVFSEKSVEIMSNSFPVYYFDPYNPGLQIDSLQVSLQSISIRCYRVIKDPSNHSLMDSFDSWSSHRARRFISHWCFGVQSKLWDCAETERADSSW